MDTQESPILKIMRFLEPNLDTNCVDLLDITDAVETIQKASKAHKKFPNHFPILGIPSYNNDVLLGEELHITFVLGNSNKIKYSNVLLRVEMVMEYADTLETCTIFEDVELEPNCKPIESHYSYLFKSVSKYRMTCSLEYSSLKGPLVVKKMFMWNCINPVQLSHTVVKLPDGTHHLETQVKNSSKTLLTLKEIKLENKTDNKIYLPLEQFNINNIRVLRPDETYSIIFTNIIVNYRNHFKEEDNTNNLDPSLDSNPEDYTNTTSSNRCIDDFYININWYSYTNISGTNVSKIDEFYDRSDLFYKVDFPKKVKINVPFQIELFLKNLTKSPVDVLIKFHSSREFILQNSNVEKLNLKDSGTLSLPFIAFCTGLHKLDGIELHCNNNCYNLKDLQVLVTE